MKKLITFSFAAFFTIILLFGCDKDNPSEPQADGVKSMTMVHFGVDFSEGKAATSDGSVVIDTPDGETIGWCPTGNGGGWGTGVWYRPISGKQYKTTARELGDVTKADTTLWDNDLLDSPLRNGDIWVSQCQDGFVAFKVIDAPMDSAAVANNPMWEVKVQYKFSTSINF